MWCRADTHLAGLRQHVVIVVIFCKDVWTFLKTGSYFTRRCRDMWIQSQIHKGVLFLWVCWWSKLITIAGAPATVWFWVYALRNNSCSSFNLYGCNPLCTVTVWYHLPRQQLVVPIPTDAQSHVNLLVLTWTRAKLLDVCVIIIVFLKNQWYFISLCA